MKSLMLLAMALCSALMLLTVLLCSGCTVSQRSPLGQAIGSGNQLSKATLWGPIPIIKVEPAEIVEDPTPWNPVIKDPCYGMTSVERVYNCSE